MVILYASIIHQGLAIAECVRWYGGIWSPTEEDGMFSNVLCIVCGMNCMQVCITVK